MTFENQKLSEQKSSTTETRAGLIYLNNKESQQNSNDTNSSPRQYYNQTRKKPQNKKDIQPQPITQSLRGLTNVTRTLYDPNAPTPKTPPISVIQPTIPTVKPSPNPLPPPPPPPPPSSVNTQQQMQEFYQQ